MARLVTTPWSRKKLVMIRKGQPQESPDVTEEESAPVGRPRAEQGGDDPLIAPQMSHSEPWLSCVDWQRKWEMSLGRAAVEGHRSLGSFRETNGCMASQRMVLQHAVCGTNCGREFA